MVRKKRVNLFAIILLIFAFVITSVILSIGNLNVSKAYSTAPDPDVNLTYSDYDTRSDGLVFDRSELDKLYGLISGGTASFTAAYDAVIGSTSVVEATKTNVATKFTNTQNYSMNFSKINNGNPITVKFGGFIWNVVYLTTNTVGNKDGKGDLVATLWMSDVDKDPTFGTYLFNDYSTTNTKDKYPSNMYSTSKIRALGLNGGGDGDIVYATSNTADTTFLNADKKTHHYAAFTMSENATTGIGRKSLTRFLTTPSQLVYQQKEDWYWSYSYDGGTVALMLNEAWGTGANGPNDSLWYTNNNSATDNNQKQTIAKTRYTDWAYQDYLWLPSLTETGFNKTGLVGSTTTDDYGTSLWGIPQTDEILKSSNDTWTRSGSSVAGATHTQALNKNGGRFAANVSATARYLRPALHLNLTAAEKSFELEVPKIADKTYNGKTQGIENDSWFKGVYESAVDVDYGLSNGEKPTVAGTYKVKLTIKANSPRKWSDGTGGSGTSKEVTYEIKKKQLTFPSIKTLPQTYAGKDNPPSFEISDYDKQFMSIAPPAEYGNTVAMNPNAPFVQATYVGKYTLNVTITDSNCEWATTDNKLQFEIKPAPVNLTLGAKDGSQTIIGGKKDSIEVRIELDNSTNVYDNEKITVNIMAAEHGVADATKIKIASASIASKATFVNTTLSDLQWVNAGKDYDLSVEVDEKSTNYDNDDYSKNYVVNNQSTPLFKVQNASFTTAIRWKLTADGTIVTGQYVDGDLSKPSVAFNGKKIAYDGKQYGFIIDPPTNYTKVGDVVTKPIGNVSFLDINIGRYAAEYESSVTITNGTDTNTYKITWKIEKALYDLTKVKWLNDGNIEYNNGATVKAILDPTTLPKGLKAKYSGVLDGDKVGDGGKIYVEFELETGYENNYELPTSGGKGTNYQFDGTDDFKWEKDWKVVPAVIKLEWDEKQHEDVNHNLFNVLELKDPRVDGKIDYVFYETDGSGNIKDINKPLTIDQIEVSLTDRKYYVAFPTVNSSYAANYVFETTDATKHYSRVFSVGGGASGVTVALDKNSIEYTGKPVNLKVNITGAATLNQLTLTYYTGDIVDDTHKFNGVPTNVGKYTVVITSNTPTVLLGGTTQFEFEITKSVISTTWNENAKPPVLSLKYGQLDAIEYVIVDSNNNPVESINDIVPGEYAIKAKIKDSAIANYIFDDDTVETAYKTFTVRDGDSLFDPSSPENPFNPKDPDAEDPTPPGEGGGNVLDKIKEFFEQLIEKGFPLWQVATMAVAGLLTLIFLIKTIQYGNRKKKAKGEAKKLNAKTFAALAPIFATDVAYAGLTNKIWSIMAFSFVGLALLMFVAALITRRAWKKAELAKETAVENIEQRKVEVQKQEREAEIQERREFKEQLALMSSGSIADTSIFEQRLLEIEERRRQEEERHRQELAELREEQAKRDEAMKLMLANMMGRQQGADNGDMPYYGSIDDTDLLVQKVIAGLLPAVQQMIPDNTAYLTAPAYEQSENDIEAIADRVAEKLGAVAPAQNNVDVDEIADKVAQRLAPVKNDVDVDDIVQKVSEKITTTTNNTTIVQDVSDEKMQAVLAEMAQMREQMDNMAYLSADEYDDTDFDDEEEWDSILDEEDDDFVEAVIIEEDGTVKKTSPNFRMRLKQSSDKNREWYAVIKNMFCSQKGVTYRVCKRVEKIRYQGQVVGVIGIAKRSIKLWLALKPYEYDARRYHHKDVSDKPRFVDVPMYVRVGSDRALTRAQELILALFQELNMEARKRYNDRDIQELIFTLKHNRLLTNKQNKQLLCEVMHVHDCDVLDDETADKCIEAKNVDFIDDSLIETVKLDDIDANFQDGNRVTLEKLKKVGLVSEECTGYTVAADKRLTKPLIVVANDFNLTAVKLITLTGGRAIKLQQI